MQVGRGALTSSSPRAPIPSAFLAGLRPSAWVQGWVLLLEEQGTGQCVQYLRH